MPAMVAVTDDKKYKTVYNRLIARGKPAKGALVAVMRKIIVAANKNLKLFYEKNENYS
jgi:hypothetical protein